MPLQPLGPQTRQKFIANGQNPDAFAYDDATDSIVPFQQPAQQQPQLMPGAAAAFLDPIARAPQDIAGGFARGVQDIGNALPAGLGGAFVGSQVPQMALGAILSNLAKPAVSALESVPRRGTTAEKVAGIVGGIIRGAAPLALGPAGIPMAAELAGISRYGDVRNQGGSPITAGLAGGIDAASMALPMVGVAGKPLLQAAVKGAGQGVAGNVAGQFAQNVLADESYAQGTPYKQGLGEAAVIGGLMGGLGGGLQSKSTQIMQPKPLLNMAGSDNLSASAVSDAPNTPPQLQPINDYRTLMRDIKSAKDPAVYEATAQKLRAQGIPDADIVRNSPYSSQIGDQAEWVQSITEAPDKVVKIAKRDPRMRDTAQLVLDGFKLTPDDFSTIINADDHTVAIQAIRARQAPEVALTKKADEVAAAKQAEQDLLDQRTQKLTADLSAERDANAFVAEKAKADHIAEVEARTAKVNADNAAEKDAMDFIAAKAKEAGITLPDGLVGAKQLGKYVEERLKLKNAASKEALENPNAYQNEPRASNEYGALGEQTGYPTPKRVGNESPLAAQLSPETTTLEPVVEQPAGGTLLAKRESFIKRSEDRKAAAQAIKQSVETGVTVPEKPETLAAQAELTADPNSSKAATLVTKGEVTPPVTAPLVQAPVAEGTLIVNPTKVDPAAAVAASNAGKGGKDLGMSQASKPEGGDMAFTVRLKDGTVVQDEVIRADQVAEAMVAARKLSPDVTFEVKPYEEVIVERVTPTEAPKPISVEAPKGGTPIAKKSSSIMDQTQMDPAAAEAAQQQLFADYIAKRKAEKAKAVVAELPVETAPVAEAPKPTPIAKKKSSIKKQEAPPEVTPLTEGERGELSVLESADEAGMLSDKQEARLEALRAKQAAEKTGEPATSEGSSVDKAGTFTTSQGSTYNINADGTTTRVKSLHTGHDPKDVGLKAASEKTLYVSPEASTAFGMMQGLSSKKKGVLIKDGRAYPVSWNEAQNKWGVSPSDKDGYTVSEAPTIGSSPLELWKQDPDGAWRSWHPGNKITELYNKATVKPTEGIGSGFKLDSRKKSQEGFVNVPGAKDVADAVDRVITFARKPIASAVSRLRDMGEVGSYAANKIQQLAEQREQYNYEAQSILSRGLKGVKPEDLATAAEYRADMSEFGVSPIRLTPAQQRAVDAFNEIALHTRLTQNKEGAYVKEGSAYRPGKFDEHYQPQMLKEDVWKKLKEGDIATRDQLVKHLLGEGYNFDEANKIYQNLSDEKPQVTDDKVDFGPLRRPEGVNYPREWLRNPVESWLSYLNKWSADMAMSKVIEQDPQMANLRGVLDDSRGGTHPELTVTRDNPAVAQNVQRALKSFASSVSPDMNMFDKANSFTSGLIVQHGSAITDVLASLPTTWAQTDIVSTAKALREVLSEGSFDRARGKGYIASFNRSNPELGTQYMSGQLSDIAVKGLDAYRTKTGLHAAQDFTRLMGSLAGEYSANAALARKDVKFFDRLDIKDPFTRPADEVIKEAANRVQKNVTSSYDVRDLPEWLVSGSNNQFGRALFGLTRFAIGQTNRQIDFMGRALRQGDIKPMLKMATGGLLTAAAANALRELLFNKKPSDMTWEEWFNLDNPEAARYLVNQASAANLGGFATQLAAQLANVTSGVKAYGPRTQAAQLADAISEHTMWLFEKAADSGLKGEDVPVLLNSFARSVMQDYRLLTEPFQQESNKREVGIYNRVVKGERAPILSQRANPLMINKKFRDADEPQELRDTATEIFQRALEGKPVPTAPNEFEEPGYYEFLNRLKGPGAGGEEYKKDLQKQMGVNRFKGIITREAGKIKPKEPKFNKEGQLEMRR